jgi:Transposase DDE domain
MIAFGLTGGGKGDAPHFPILLGLGPDIEPRAAVGDKGYASKANRQAARKRGIIPVIPHKANEKQKPGFFAKALYPGFPRWIGVRPASCTDFRWWAKTLRQITWPSPDGRDG